MADEISCVCSHCRKKFLYKDAVVKKRKLFNVEIEEKCCPYCGSKGFTNSSDIFELAQIASHHRYTS